MERNARIHTRQKSRLAATTILVLVFSLLLSGNALALVGSDPMPYAVKSDWYLRDWYDPQDWFQEGGSIDYQQGWYAAVYGPESEDVFGYFAEDASRTEPAEGQMATLDGIIDDIAAYTPVGGANEWYIFAQVQSRLDAETAERVALGSLDQIAPLELRVGDPVTISGVRGPIDERDILVARRIETERGAVDIRQAAALGPRPMRVQVLNTRTASFQRENMPDQIMARVRLDNGAATVVNLGPEGNLPDYRNLEGQEIAMIARPARVNGKSALIAEELQMNGQTIDIHGAR